MLAATLPTASTDELSNTADWLATLYQQRYWSSLQPDPLAEHLIGSVLRTDGRCATLLGDSISGASSGQRTLLARAQPHHPHLARTISDAVLADGARTGSAAIAVAPRLEQPQPLLAALDRLTQTADLATLRALNDTLPRHSTLLGPTSLKLTAGLLRLLRTAAASDRDAYLPDLATSLNNHAALLAETGQRELAIALASEAGEHYHRLAVTDPDLFTQAAEQTENFVSYLREPGVGEHRGCWPWPGHPLMTADQAHQGVAPVRIRQACVQIHDQAGQGRPEGRVVRLPSQANHRGHALPQLGPPRRVEVHRFADLRGGQRQPQRR